MKIKFDISVYMMSYLLWIVGCLCILLITWWIGELDVSTPAWIMVLLVLNALSGIYSPMMFETLDKQKDKEGE